MDFNDYPNNNLVMYQPDYYMWEPYNEMWGSYVYSDEDLFRSYFVKDKEEQPKEAVSSEELVEFAKKFKQIRMRNGHTQADVGNALGNLYGSYLSQTTVCRFESLQLSTKNMCKLKPLLEKWVDEITRDTMDNCIPEKHTHSQKRKKRTPIDNSLKYALEKYFFQNPKPVSNTLRRIASSLNLDKDVVRVWFCNRRQKAKRDKLDHLEEIPTNHNLFFNTNEGDMFFLGDPPNYFSTKQ
ncbi:POU domain, class 3, transcription factor 3-like [Octopus sinensis]|uniref:POU domain, class 3, transcription factor 3-like n=1 Tax=Octopus sinensis TaxID=2607531 RepID=A0A6P7TYA5_9MOLL|nr:POU domain, class 3, transcription factor 3-like [Octopus sinensis]